jgi:hypothetical protein
MRYGNPEVARLLLPLLARERLREAEAYRLGRLAAGQARRPAPGPVRRLLARLGQWLGSQGSGLARLGSPVDVPQDSKARTGSQPGQV